MKRIGLTGNIGTGKSTIARIFEILGVPVYHADNQAKIILNSAGVKDQILLLFGKSIFNSQNQIDRKALAEIVFSDKNKLESLNALIHPLVEADFSEWCTVNQNNKYILHEAAILFESGFDKLFDSTILVIAPIELCIERVIKRDLATREMVMDRMQNQWPQEIKQGLADYVIVNDEKSMVISQVLTIHRGILNSFQ